MIPRSMSMTLRDLCHHQPPTYEAEHDIANEHVRMRCCEHMRVDDEKNIATSLPDIYHDEVESNVRMRCGNAMSDRLLSVLFEICTVNIR